MDTLSKLKTKIFADCAGLDTIKQLASVPWVKGFTTNPTLMRKAGVINYQTFATQALSMVKNQPISFEVFADSLEEMEEQALEINSWGKNIYIKIPVMNTQKKLTVDVVKSLSKKGVAINVTAVFTLEQIELVFDALDHEVSAIISVFAGRIADTGRDPIKTMAQALKMIRKKPRVKLLWASPRELLNLFQANLIGCDIITMDYGLLKKVPLIGKNLEEFSLETVKMFYDDAVASNFDISCNASHIL